MRSVDEIKYDIDTILMMFKAKLIMDDEAEPFRRRLKDLTNELTKSERLLEVE